jgi:hypothetical protein
MFQSARLGPSVLCTLFAIAALTGCDLQTGSASIAQTTAPDPRVVKAFSPTASWFCAIPIQYSDTTGTTNTTVNTMIVETAENKTAIDKSLKDACTASAAPAKTLCTAMISSSSYKCVSPIVYITMPDVAGVWSCTMDYSLNDKPQTLSVDGESTGIGAVDAMFAKCAALKDADGKGTTQRDACAKAMIAEKMTCQDLNAAEPVSTTPKYRVFRERKHS